MRETELEAHLVWTAAVMGGGTYKFKSITNRGVADRIVCLPNGATWFIEVKTETGKISSLQKVFAEDMRTLKQKYACFWSKEEIDQWRAEQESDDRFCSYCGTKITKGVASHEK